MAGVTIEIRTIEMLRDMYKSSPVKGAYLSLPSIADKDIRTSLELNLNKYYSECGCGTGLTGLKISIVLSLIFLTIGYLSYGFASFKLYGCVMSIAVVGGSITGKIIGRRVARKNFRRAVESVHSYFKIVNHKPK